MALKVSREHICSNSSYFANKAMERGGFASILDDNLVGYAKNPISFFGCLLQDVVNLDLSLNHLRYYKDEVQIGSRVTILTRGVVTTNFITFKIKEVAGKTAYLSSFGRLTHIPTKIRVGMFLSNTDSDGFVKVSF